LGPHINIQKIQNTKEKNKIIKKVRKKIYISGKNTKNLLKIAKKKKWLRRIKISKVEN